MQTLKRIPYVVSLVLLAYMPLHIFLSQWLSTYTGGLEAWKIGKDVLLLVVALFTICLVWAQGKGSKAFNSLVGLAAAYGAVHLLLWALNPNIYSRSAEIGIIYNMRLPLCAVLGFGAYILYPGKFAFSSVIKFILAVSTIVATFGVLQYFLPGDLLSHFGYSLERGTRSAFYIDNDTSLPIRVMSTLREPNALGAYLLLPVAYLCWLLLNVQDKKKRLLVCGVLGLHLLAIFMTYSRSAWLGVVVIVAFTGWWHREAALSLLRKFWVTVTVALALLAVGTFAIRNTSLYQQYVVHSNPNEQAADLDSNDYHKLLVKQGLEGIKHEPLGHGPGTAGLASIQNPKGGQLTENYYVQIGYELGIVGLLIFLIINVWLYANISRRGDYLAFILCASFWAYLLTNMLLHTWSNEAVAAQWWILAGMAFAASPLLKADK